VSRRRETVMGTVEYMAPEQARDSRRVDYRADIYSLGATFYKLLTGHSPFATSGNITAMSQVLAHVQAPAPPVRNYRPDVPADVAMFLERMLSKSPHERPDSADEIAAALAPHCRTAALRPLLETTSIRSERSTDDRLAATVVELPPVRVADHGKRPFPWLIAGVAFGLLMLVMGCLVGLAVWTVRPTSGFVVVKAESDEATDALRSEPVFLVRRDNNARMLLQTGRRRLPAGDYVIETEADSALVFSPNRFTVRRNQQLVLQASLASLNEMAMSVEPEMAEIGPALAASGPPVDLIPLLDPVRDIRGDDWRIVDGTLVSDASKNSMLHFPYRPPASYRLEMTAERLQFDESLNIGLVAGDNPLIITVDGYPKAGSYSGVYRVDGIGPTHQPSRNTHRGLVLPLNRPVQLVATVQYAAGRAAVQLDADGRRIFSWRGTANRAGTSPLMQPNEPSALCLGNDTASIRLSNVRLVPLEGEGEPIVFADPADDPQRAAAERAIWKGGSVTLLADESTPRAQLEAPPVLDNIQPQRRFEGHTQPVKTVV
ncbi:MAG: hypothetical protein KDA59_24890, partial [Planctomycetales bacterium]|nr:hypothetical protein [Planctomycetales bacterium]